MFTMQRNIQYIFWAVSACMLWGTAFVGGKIGFLYMGPLRLSGLRFIIAGLMLVPLLLVQRVSLKNTLKHWRMILLFSIMQTFLQYGLFFWGLNLVPAATAALVVGGGPLVIAVMAHFFMPDDLLTRRKVFAIFLGIAGVFFIALTKGQMIGEGWSFYGGIILLIVSILIGGGTNIIVAKYLGDLHPVGLTALANLSGGVLLYLFSLIVEPAVDNGMPSSFFIALFWLAFISAYGFSVWYTILQKPGVKVGEINVWKFVIPVTGCVLSWAILPGEYPDWSSIIGIVVITVSLLIFQWPIKSTVKV